MIYQQETFHDVIGKIEPLLEAHYEEIAKYKDIPLRPDWKMYIQLETLGVLKIFTCRSAATRELQGYAIYFVKTHLHYHTCLIAQQDILYLVPEARGQGGRFILWCDRQLKAIGCQMVVQHIKASHNFGPMLERMGYELMDLIYTKRLDKEI